MAQDFHYTNFNSNQPICIYLLWAEETKIRKTYFLTWQYLLFGSENENTQIIRHNSFQNGTIEPFTTTYMSHADFLLECYIMFLPRGSFIFFLIHFKNIPFPQSFCVLNNKHNSILSFRNLLDHHLKHLFPQTLKVSKFFFIFMSFNSVLVRKEQNCSIILK